MKKTIGILAAILVVATCAANAAAGAIQTNRVHYGTHKPILLECGTGASCTISLEKGEYISTVSMGADQKDAWSPRVPQVQDVEPTLIVLSPLEDKLQTNLHVTSVSAAGEARRYDIMLRSRKGAPATQLVFAYGADTTIVYTAAPRPLPSPAKRCAPDLNDTAGLVDLAVSSNRVFGPIRAYVKGECTFVQVSTAATPILYRVGSDGRDEVINFRTSGNFYILDTAEFHLSLVDGANRVTIGK